MNPQETDQPRPQSLEGQTPTPRTDADKFAVLSDLQSGTRDVVDADFARTLERELANALDQWNRLIDEHHKTGEAVSDLRHRLAQSEQALQEARGAIATWRELAHKGYERWQENLDGDHRTIVQLRDQLTASEQYLGEAQTAVARGAERAVAIVDHLAEVFGQYHKGKIYIEDVAGACRMAKAELSALPPSTPAQPEAGDGGGTTDTQRLDWLDQNCPNYSVGRTMNAPESPDPMPFAFRYGLGSRAKTIPFRGSVRHAIDAAMQGKTQAQDPFPPLYDGPLADVCEHGTPKGNLCQKCDVIQPSPSVQPSANGAKRITGEESQ